MKLQYRLRKIVDRNNRLKIPLSCVSSPREIIQLSLMGFTVANTYKGPNIDILDLTSNTMYNKLEFMGHEPFINGKWTKGVYYKFKGHPNNTVCYNLMDYGKTWLILKNAPLPF